jgi:hypothetical protein
MTAFAYLAAAHKQLGRVRGMIDHTFLDPKNAIPMRVALGEAMDGRIGRGHEMDQVSVETVARAAWACGYTMVVTFKPESPLTEDPPVDSTE